MANKDDYLTYYREFFENFAQTINPDDQLPVKLSSYKLINVEVVGAIIDWTTQYLTQKKCPVQLISPLIKIVIEEIRKACKKQPIDCGFSPTDNAYEPLKLMQTVMTKINEVCLRYLDNSMLCSLPSSGSAYFATSVCAVRNSRRKMEDRHVVIHDLNTMFNIQEASPSSYYAIFDGHAGFHAASYSSTHLHQYLAESEHFIVNPEQALIDAFLKTDTLFIDKWRNENFSSMSSSSGTTAVVALFRPKEKTLYVAWVGDSQALLVNQGRILQIVNPHKPSREDERERILKQGGRVMVWGIWRVDGQLAVSRAIGDAEYKPYVTAMPDIREIPLDGGEDFLILACDGLWDVVSEDCAARTVYNLIAENPEDTDRISPYLVQLAKSQRSTDNISVIVVFLREPSKIAAEAHWANRNCPTSEMETTGLDNANNPFTLSNGASNDIDNVISTQKGDGLLLNLTDNFKQNGTSLPVSDFFMSEKSNGKRSTSDFDDDDDFGPESNVDAVDDVLSPTSKKFEDNIFQDKAFEGHYNPFMEHQEKAALETEKNLQKKEEQKEKDDTENTNIHEEEEDDDEFDEIAKDFKGANEKEEFHSEFQQQLENTQRLAREETPTPPADTVHNVSGLVDNTADSESEDEWNYIKGEVANKENIPPQPEKEVAEIPEEDDSMSQLNPNAAEFVPVSPTSSAPSPICRSLINDEVIAQSPSRVQQDIDINLPNPRDFEKEVKSRPSEVDSFNGHDEDLNKSSDLINNLLNGKNIDEIPEFQPGSTPKKSGPTEEFHFGPNAVQFTPVKLFDQSEAGLSTRAVYGDESVATLEESLNESSTAPELPVKTKESDPMSMSFYEDRDNNLFDDLNKVQVIPDNLEEFLQQPEVKNSSFDETISDLPEHHPLGEPENVEVSLNNDDAIQVTDLDKHFYDDEKELASPLEPEKELFGEEESEPIKTPEPTHENLLGSEFCCVPKGSEQADLLAGNNEIVSFDNDLEGGGVATEVDDLLKTETVNLPPDVEMIPPELPSEVTAKSPAFDKLETDLVCERPTSKSSLVESSGAASPALEKSEVCERPGSGLIVCERPESGLLVCERPESGPLLCERPESKSPVCESSESKSPICERPESKSPICERPESKSPICERPESKSPVCERPESKSSVCERPESQSPVCERPKLELPVGERPESDSPVCERPMSQSPVFERPESGSDKRESESPVQNPTFDRPVSTSPICERPQSDSPVCQQDLASPVCPLPASKEFGIGDIPNSPIPNETVGLTPDFITSHQIEEAQKNFEELCRPQEKGESFHEDAVTSSIKDDVSSPSPDHVQTESFELIETSAVIPTDASGSLIDTSVVKSDAEDSLVKNDDQISAMPIQTQGEEIDVKTDKITPEFAEQAVITPSEESKQEEIPSITVEEPQEKEIEVIKPANSEPVVEVASAAAVGIAVAATAAAVAKTPETKVSEKKSTTSATKKTTPRVGSATKAPTPKASPKPAAPKSGPAKPTTSSLGARTLSATTKPQAKPKAPTPATSSAPKSADKKSLTNGDIKTAVKSSLTARKETTATKTSSTTIKSSPNKPPTPKAAAPPKPLTKTTAAPKPFTAKPAPSTTTRPPTTTAKRPTTLTANKSAASSTLTPKTTTSATSSVAAKSSVTKTSPKVPTAPKPRPPPTTTAVPKPRVPLSKTVAKAPDTEKQNKESANKLTASKSATGTTATKTIGATRVIASSTARRVESKTSSTRITAVSKTTTTTMKSTTGKKPIEIVRNAANKTKTTKIEKPKENGESTVVTEELTSVVHTTNNSIAVDGDPQLMKDNSPLDNKLIINSFVDTDVVAD